MTQRDELSFSQFLTASPPFPPILLLYGNDSEKVDSASTLLINRIAKENAATPSSAGRFERIDAAEIAKEPNKLFDLFASVGLFGDSQSLLIENAGEKHAKLFQGVF